MARKKASLISLIFLGAGLVFSFLPCIYERRFLEREWNGSYGTSHITSVSVFEAADFGFGLDLFGILVLLFYIFSIIGVITLSMVFMEKSFKRQNIALYSPIASVGTFLLMSLAYFSEESPLEGRWAFVQEPGFGFLLDWQFL